MGAVVSGGYVKRSTIDSQPCPHCGAMFNALWDYSWEGNELVATTCGECEKPVDIRRKVAVTYMITPHESRANYSAIPNSSDNSEHPYSGQLSSKNRP